MGSKIKKIDPSIGDQLLYQLTPLSPKSLATVTHVTPQFFEVNAIGFGKIPKNTATKHRYTFYSPTKQELINFSSDEATLKKLNQMRYFFTYKFSLNLVKNHLSIEQFDSLYELVNLIDKSTPN